MPRSPPCVPGRQVQRSWTWVVHPCEGHGSVDDKSPTPVLPGHAVDGCCNGLSSSPTSSALVMSKPPTSAPVPPPEAFDDTQQSSSF
jgi:hypothetical protein